MSQGHSLPSMPLAERESGIVVPAHLADLPTPDAPTVQVDRVGATNPDGRRRVVLPRSARKLMLKLAAELGPLDMGVFFGCRTVRYRTEILRDAKTNEPLPVQVKEEIPGACGEIMLREGEDTDDPGFGCKCSRVHFLRGSDAPPRV